MEVICASYFREKTETQKLDFTNDKMRVLWYEKREFNKFSELESLCILLQSIAHIADQFY